MTYDVARSEYLKTAKRMLPEWLGTFCPAIVETPKTTGPAKSPKQKTPPRPRSARKTPPDRTPTPKLDAGSHTASPRSSSFGDTKRTPLRQSEESRSASGAQTGSRDAPREMTASPAFVSPIMAQFTSPLRLEPTKAPSGTPPSRPMAIRSTPPPSRKERAEKGEREELLPEYADLIDASSSHAESVGSPTKLKFGGEEIDLDALELEHAEDAVSSNPGDRMAWHATTDPPLDCDVRPRKQAAASSGHGAEQTPGRETISRAASPFLSDPAAGKLSPQTSLGKGTRFGTLVPEDSASTAISTSNPGYESSTDMGAQSDDEGAAFAVRPEGGPAAVQGGNGGDGDRGGMSAPDRQGAGSDMPRVTGRRPQTDGYGYPKASIANRTFDTDTEESEVFHPTRHLRPVQSSSDEFDF